MPEFQSGALIDNRPEALKQKDYNVAETIASAFVAGFSGLMFALLGDSMSLPGPLPHIMAGVGGFFGDQTMKFIMEYLTNKKVK